MALLQSSDPEKIQEQVSVDPRSAPFTRVLQQVPRVLIVRNRKIDLYTRVWCCWELYLAYELGLTSKCGGVQVVGPNHFLEPVDIEHAETSNKDDKERILECINVADDLGVGRVNIIVNAIKNIPNTEDLHHSVAELR